MRIEARRLQSLQLIDGVHTVFNNHLSICHVLNWRFRVLVGNYFSWGEFWRLLSKLMVIVLNGNIVWWFCSFFLEIFKNLLIEFITAFKNFGIITLPIKRIEVKNIVGVGNWALRLNFDKLKLIFCLNYLPFHFNWHWLWYLFNLELFSMDLPLSFSYDVESKWTWIFLASFFSKVMNYSLNLNVHVWVYFCGLDWHLYYPWFVYLFHTLFFSDLLFHFFVEIEFFLNKITLWTLSLIFSWNFWRLHIGRRRNLNFSLWFWDWMQRFNTLINRHYLDRHLYNLRYFRNSRTRLALLGLNCHLGNIYFEFDIDRHFTYDGIKNNLHG